MRLKYVAFKFSCRRLAIYLDKSGCIISKSVLVCARGSQLF
jgi:hypothetical protein